MWVLLGFEPQGDRLVAEYRLACIDASEMRAVLNQPGNDLLYGSFPASPQVIEQLRNLSDDRSIGTIDADYFVEFEFTRGGPRDMLALRGLGDDEQVVAEYPLKGVRITSMRALLKLPEDDPMFGSFPVTEQAIDECAIWLVTRLSVRCQRPTSWNFRECVQHRALFFARLCRRSTSGAVSPSGHRHREDARATETTRRADAWLIAGISRDSRTVA